MVSSTRYGLEKTILATYIYADIMDMEEFKEVRDTKCPINHFKANLTTKSVAKAIYNLQELDYPIDETIVKDYIEKRMPLDYDEYLKILTTTCVPLKAFKHYINLLIETDKNDMNGNYNARI